MAFPRLRLGLRLLAGILALGAAAYSQTPTTSARPGAISGVIIEAETNKPIAGAVVTVFEGLTLSSNEATYRAVTASDGSFQFVGVAPGYYSLIATARGRLTSEFGAFRSGETGTKLAIRNSPITGILVTLEKAPSLAGTVRDAAGRGLAGTGVTAKRIGNRSGSTVTTGPNGQYRFDELQPGTYLISIYESRAYGPPPPVYHPGSRDPVNAIAISVRPNDSLAGVDIKVPAEATSTIVGTVIDANGLPVPKALVSAFHELSVIRQTLASLDGRFVLHDIPAGAVAVSAGQSEPLRGPASAKAMLELRLAAWGESRVAVSAESRVETQVLLRTASSATGQVRFTGEPSAVRPALSVSFLPKLRLVQPASGPVSDGRFTVGGLVPGDYEISIRTEDPTWILTRVESAMVRSGAEVRVPALGSPEFVLHVERATSRISGFVRDAAGAGAAGYWVVIFPADRALLYARSPCVARVRPALDGRYDFAGLPAGAYRIAVAADNAAVASDILAFIDSIQDVAVSISVASNEETVHDFVIKQKGVR